MPRFFDIHLIRGNDTMRRLLLICGLVLVALGSAHSGQGLERFESVVNPLVEAFNEGDYEFLRSDWNRTMREALPPDKTESFFSGIRRRRGTIVEVKQGKLNRPRTGIFLLVFSNGSRMVLELVLDDKDQIAGLWIRPPKPAIPVPERNRTKLSLPFRGWWHVTWGGDTKDLNRHHGVRSQQYAFDFLVVDAEGISHDGSGDKNEDYYAFGKDLLAPAPGKVVEVIRGVHDCEPRTMNSYSALGNAVFIRHQPHEVSVLAHLKRGSIKVKRGQQVDRGQIIGQCGNSGNSSEPHLHYHLQNTSRIEEATGIKCFFDAIRVEDDGEVRQPDEYSPVKNDRIGPSSKRNQTPEN